MQMEPRWTYRHVLHPRFERVQGLLFRLASTVIVQPLGGFV
jgi:hypothetical protein